MIIHIKTNFIRDDEALEVDDQLNLLQLKEFISAQIGIPADEIELLAGFPPLLLPHTSPAGQSLAAIGITNETRIIARPSTNRIIQKEELQENLINAILAKTKNYSYQEVADLCHDRELRFPDHTTVAISLHDTSTTTESGNDSVENDLKVKFYCHDCDTYLDSPDALKQHYQATAHENFGELKHQSVIAFIE